MALITSDNPCAPTAARAHSCVRLTVVSPQVVFGGLTGYVSDDMNKLLWMIRVRRLAHVHRSGGIRGRHQPSSGLARKCGLPTAWMAPITSDYVVRHASVDYPQHGWPQSPRIRDAQ